MNRQRKLATWMGTLLGACTALLVLAVSAHASDCGTLQQEFHQTYPLTADGRIELDNINGAVHITAWDRNEVKVDAVKRANTKERMDEAQIKIHAGPDSISIHTEYPGHNHTFNSDGCDNPASVEYTLTVPRTARLDEIKLINGSLDLTGVTGEVRANTINGRLEARDVGGRTELSTVNGRLEARFSQLGASRIELSSVNGSVELVLPSDAKAEIEANTVMGGISNDFGLKVNKHFMAHDLHGELAGGGTHIELHNVNGRIEIRHADDGRAMSPAKDLNGNARDDDDDDSI